MQMFGGPSRRKHRREELPEWWCQLPTAEKEKRRIEHWQSVSLADVGLPVRIANTLENCGIFTVGQLAEQTEIRLKKIPNLGNITIIKCKALLKKLNVPNQLG